jgi:hypothetical protein
VARGAPQGLRAGYFREEIGMKRTTVPFPMILLVLLGIMVLAAPALASADDDAIVRPGAGRDAADLIVNTDGTADDDQSGDPDTAGDSLGYGKLPDILGGSSSQCDSSSADLEMLRIWLMTMVAIIR